MKSMIDRLKRRAPPTTASARAFSPAIMHIRHSQKHYPTSSSNNRQHVENKAVPVAPSPKSSSPILPSLPPTSSEGAPRPASEFPRQPIVIREDSPPLLSQAPKQPDTTEEISLELTSQKKMDDSLSTASSSYHQCSLSSHISENFQDKSLDHPSSESDEESKHVDVGNTDRSSDQPNPKTSSINTFGKKNHDQNHRKLNSMFASQSDPAEKEYILKPVTHETIYKHVVEEVQKVKLHERHLTYIQHHVQPIVDHVTVSKDVDYRIKLAESEDSVQASKQKADLGSKLSEYVRENRSQYENYQQLYSDLQSIVLSDLEHHSIVVHHYHVIQPMIANSDRVSKECAPCVNNSNTTNLHTAAKVEPIVIPDPFSPQLKILNKLVDDLQKENKNLKKLLSTSVKAQNYLS